MERLQPLASRSALLPFPAALGDPLAALEPLPGTIEVMHGIHGDWLPLAGRTVGEVRRRVADHLGLHPEARAHIAGRAVADEVRVRSGERLEFQRSSGEKGGPCPRPGGRT